MMINIRIQNITVYFLTIRDRTLRTDIRRFSFSWVVEFYLLYCLFRLS